MISSVENQTSEVTKDDTELTNSIPKVSSRQRSLRRYRGIRRPRSNDPELLAIYDAKRRTGFREKRLRKTSRQYKENLQDAGLIG